MTSDGASLEAIGYDDHFEARLAALQGTFVPARIAISHGESYVAWALRGSCTAVLVRRGADEWREAIDRPQVGDWVAGRYAEAADTLLIEHVLGRRTCLMRQAAGERTAAQIIASNVDVVGIVSAFGERKGHARSRRLINEPRLQRYLAAVRQSGAAAVLIVNKSDLSEDPAATADSLGHLFPGVPVVLTSATGRLGLDGLTPWLAPGKTLGLVGMSGVGKSTLVNALLGRAAQRVGDVRDDDSRGRHTTTHRELLVLESGALLIDTPGMRELGLWEAESAPVFDDIVAIAGGCRFSDCRHDTEPGCAIQDALTNGSLSPDRWASYQRLESGADGPRTRGRSSPGGRGGKPYPRRR